MMKEAMEQFVDNLSNTVTPAENEYMGDDGLLHCTVCHKATQTQVNVFGEDRIVRCICDCRKKELEEHEQREKQQELERQRRNCFAETNMAGWNFANDDRSNPKLSDAMKKYAEDFKDFKKESKGLLLYGSVGTGKTYYAACIANSLIDQGYRVLMTNFARLTNQLQGKFEDRQKYIDSLNEYSLLIIDDLGAERNSEFMKEMVFNIIDSRYRAGLPFIITTNLTAEVLKNPDDIGYQRIYDRILERCLPIEINGVSRRRVSLKNTNSDMRNKLGL